MIKLLPILSEIKLYRKEKVTPEQLEDLDNVVYMKDNEKRYEILNKYGYQGIIAGPTSYEFFQNLPYNKLKQIYIEYSKILSKYNINNNINELNLINPKSFPKDIEWAYKVKSPEDFKVLLKKLKSLGYKWISNNDINVNDNKYLENYNYIINHKYSRDKIGWTNNVSDRIILK